LEGTILLRTKLLGVTGAVAAIATLGITAASASAVPNATKSVTGIQAESVRCTATTCVVVGMDAADTAGKTALINPATGAVKLGSGTLAGDYGAGVACPDKTTCLSDAYGGNHDQISEIIAISTKTGAAKVRAKLPGSEQYDVFGLACPSSKYCYVVGHSAAPGIQLPTWALLLKVSPAGKILSKTINKSYYGYGPIACESSSTCLVGRETKKSGFQAVPLVNGKFGKPHALPSNFAPFSFSCYSTKLCYASGGLGEQGSPELIPLNPKTGAPGKAITLGKLGGGATAGLACYSSTQCVVASYIVVGSGYGAYSEASYALVTKGKLGKIVAVSKAKGSNFNSVACANAKECYAVGFDAVNNQSIVAKV
jgi:hypothetical protein